jgi:hypothetical protein
MPQLIAYLTLTAALVGAAAYIAERLCAALHKPRRFVWIAALAGEVLVSARMGPAIFGLAKPRIIFPQWLLDAPSEAQRLVLLHEREHAAARDPLLLSAGLLLVTLAPWNPALWWQLHRLRFGMELDCDARVVRGGADPVAYSTVLLSMLQRRAVSPLPAVALIEPRSQLERRVRAMLRAPGALYRAVAVSSGPLAAVLLAVAYAFTPPELFAQVSPDDAAIATDRDAATIYREPFTGMEFGGNRVVVLVDTSASMIGRTTVKWRQTIGIVENLAARLQPGTQFQALAFGASAEPLLPGSAGQWLTANDDNIEQALQALRTTAAPAEASSNLEAAFTAAAALEPPAEYIYLVTDGLPNAGPGRGAIDDTDVGRARLFAQASAAVPPNASVNVVLLPRANDPISAPAFWSLALGTGGTLVAPAAVNELGVGPSRRAR